MKRKKKKHAPDTASLSKTKGDVMTVLNDKLERYDRWIPWALGFIYFSVMSYLTFRYHRIGGLGVETDFYVELAPQVKKLLAGEFSPLNYGAKGPVYSLLLSAFYLVVRDYFYAGLALNLVSGTVFLVVLYRLIKIMFSAVGAVLVTVSVAGNFVFLTYTYQAGSDIPFMALCILSMYFLFRKDSRRGLILSGLFGSLAFLTRYNGAFIAAGSLVYLALNYGTVQEKLKKIGLWFGVFFLAGLPWFVPNFIVTGNPVQNANYMNVMLEFYGGDSYENWTDALPKEFTGMGDVIFYDPVYFAKHMAYNVYSHFVSDIQSLVSAGMSIALLLGFIVFLISKPGRKKLLFYFFGAVYFLILTLVFYNARFSLYLLVFYVSLAVCPLVSHAVAGKLKRYSFIPAVVLSILIFQQSYVSVRGIYASIRNSPPILEGLKDLGRALDDVESDKSKKLLGRKPHVAYFAGLDAIMFPESIKSVDNLVRYCRDNGVDYVLYSGIEAAYRPDVRALLAVSAPHQGLEKVYHNDFGVIYRVMP